MLPSQSRPIGGFPAYRVDRQGRVWSCWEKRRKAHGLVWELGETWRELQPQVMPKGYRRVILRSNNRRALKLVHRLVLEAFVGPCPQGKQARHRDGNPGNNQATNLRWSTPKQNASDKIEHGTYRRGEHHGLSKLTERAVRFIRRSAQPQRVLARRFKVSRSLISLVKHGQVWGWLTQ